MNRQSGRRSLGFLVACLLLLVPAGCVTKTTVVPAVAGPVEPPPAVNAPFKPPSPLGPIFAPGEVRELVPGGAIDWSGKAVRARGAGVLDPGNSNRDVARQMAERAATVVARRNLFEIVKGVRVDSDTRVHDLMASYDSVYRRIEVVVKGARLHGPARYDSVAGIVEVEMECDLYGESGVEGAVAPLPAAAPQPEENAAADLSPAAQEFLSHYSALVLDGASAGLKPALFPKLYDDGALLLDPQELVDAGTPGAHTVQYVGEFDRILGRPDLGQPLTLRVREAHGKSGSDAVLGRADAGLLREMPAVLEFLLGRGRIIIKTTL
ncbi:hypothetical protein JXD38_01150 [candidate division WOR-3 bacterium]|nr:hypothetical protein [candidate division WOR-3 bacterium]